MSLFSPIMCALGWHDPKRRDVKWDGRSYRGACRHGGTEIIRISSKTWRKPKEPA
jgi:hypothetical protein